MTVRDVARADHAPSSTPPGPWSRERLAPTPLVPAPALGDDVLLKLETLQPTGSFKVRGALAALSRAGGAPVITASAGNAGLGVAWAATALGVEATVVVAETASPAKIAALAALPVTPDPARRRLRRGGGACARARGARRDVRLLLQRHGRDRGAGDDRARARRPAAGRPTVACPLGGGSLASGLGPVGGGAARERASSRSRPSARPAFSTALAAGEITPIEVGETIADGLAGNIEPGAVTFELVRDHVAAVVSVSEPEIEEAIRFLARAHGIVAEGAGAAAVAAVLAGRVERGDGPAGGPRHGPQHRARRGSRRCSAERRLAACLLIACSP